MKAVITQARESFKVGDQVEVTAEEFAVLADAGCAITATEHAAQERIKASEQATIKAREKRIDEALVQGVKDGRFLAKEDTTTVKASAMAMEGAQEGAGIGYILSLPVKADNKDLAKRMSPTATEGLVVKASLEDECQGVIKATEPQNNLIKSGNFVKAAELSKEAGMILKRSVMARGDFMLRDTVRAATYTDPNSQVGSLAGDLIIMRNLGYLVNKLAWLKFLTTDLTGEPVKFGQSILTRYITPPAVLTWVPGVGFTNAADAGFGAQQVSDAGTGTTQSAGITLRAGAAGNYALDATNAWGIPNKSQPSVTDKSVTLNMFKATEVEFPVSSLAGTVRNLLSEQLGAQTYSLAEEINKYMMAVIFAATWSGTKTSYTKALANWNLSGMIGLKNAMTISKIPDVGRFALLHSFYHDKLLEDSNLLSAKAIMALVHKDESEFNTGEIPTLFGIKPLESQLASATSAGVLTTWTDDASLGTTTRVGFAGNMSSALFVSRPPQDFTQTATQLGIPVTASVRLMTEPDSGLTVMVFSYVDNGKMSISQRVCLMWGGAQGDPRVGLILKAVAE